MAKQKTTTVEIVVGTLGFLAIIMVLIYAFTMVTLSNYVPALPDVSVAASAQSITPLSPTSARASPLRLALHFSNNFYTHTLSFRNVTLSLGGALILHHPPFNVSGDGRPSFAFFRLDNATLGADSSGLVSVRVELEAVGHTLWGVWPVIPKEGWVRARCDPVTVSYSLNEYDDDADYRRTFKAEAGGCTTTGLWKTSQERISHITTLCFVIITLTLAFFATRLPPQSSYYFE